MNNELVQYIENEIFPLYNRNEEGHGIKNSNKKKNYPNLSKEKQIERIYQHLTKKYGENGYAKIYLEDKEFEEALNKLRQELSNKEEFIKRVKK